MTRSKRRVKRIIRRGIVRPKVGRPPNEERSVILSARVPESIAEIVEKYAEKMGLSINKLITNLLVEKIKELEKND